MKYKYFLSNQLNKSIYSAIKEAKNCGQNTISLDFFLLGLLGQKNSMAFKIFQKIYKDDERVLKNLKDLIYGFHQRKNYQQKEKLEISFTPVLERFLFKRCLKLWKSGSVFKTKKKVLWRLRVITTKDIFFLILSSKMSKRLSLILKKANQKI